jgi:hypothetical protein
VRSSAPIRARRRGLPPPSPLGLNAIGNIRIPAVEPEDPRMDILMARAAQEHAVRRRPSAADAARLDMMDVVTTATADTAPPAVPSPHCVAHGRAAPFLGQRKRGELLFESGCQDCAKLSGR